MRRLIFFYKLTFVFNNFFKIGKTLTAKKLFKYFKKSLYAVSPVLFYLFNRFNFLNIYWEIKPERENV